MSMLTWCQKEQWSYWVRRASGSWDFVCDSSLKFMLDLNCWRRCNRLGEDEKETLRAGRWTLYVSQSSKNLMEKKKTKRLKREISFCQFLFFFCKKFQCSSFLLFFCQLKLHWGWWCPRTDGRVHNPVSPTDICFHVNIKGTFSEVSCFMFSIFSRVLAFMSSKAAAATFILFWVQLQMNYG